MNEIILYLLSGIITVCVTAATRAVIAWLKQKNLLITARIAVEAAEQMLRKSGMGPQKKKQAKAYILSKFPRLSEADLDAIIEAAVLGLNQGAGRGEDEDDCVREGALDNYIL